MSTELELTACPECGRPAEIVQRVTLPSADGPVEHVKTRCVTGPWFFVPAEDLAACQAGSAGSRRSTPIRPARSFPPPPSRHAARR